MDKKAKEGSFAPIFIVMAISLAIAAMWDKIPEIKNTANAILNPTLGTLLDWHLTLGMFLIVILISFITLLIQKYATDQESLKELKKEQKILQQEMKKYKDNPEKIMELQKKQLEFIPKTMKLTSRSIVYTGVPLIILFRWFNDYFANLGEVKLLGIFSWFWFYLIFVIFFSTLLRKWLKVA